MTTAEPCTNCRTTQGAWDRITQAPWRKDGLCAACYQSRLLHQEVPIARATRTGYPCADCRSTSGYIPPQCTRPRRTYGLCDTCYGHHRSAGTIDRYKDRAQHPRRGGRTMLPSIRREQRVQLIAMRVARHHTIGFIAPQPVVEGEYDARAVIADTERAAAAWQDAHPEQTAIWDAPECAA